MKKLSSYDKSLSPTSDLPFGMFKDETSSGSNDGTEIVAAHMQDLYYALYSVLQLAGIQPNGNLENGSTSKQFLSALSSISTCMWNNTTTYSKNVVVFNIFNNEVSFYQSLQDGNAATLSNTSFWRLIAKINSSGVWSNMNFLSPALSGVPTAPTAAAGTANTQIATTAFVKSAMRKFIKITSGRSTNGATVSPPSGFTMSDLVAFIPAISEIHYSGDVDGNDSTYCKYTINETNISLEIRSTEQRKATYANWIAIWIKS